MKPASRFVCPTLFFCLIAAAFAQGPSPAKENSPAPAADSKVLPINLPTGKTLPQSSISQAVNSFPVTLAVSPDGRYVVSLNNGHGTAESGIHQSLAVLDLQTNELTDFPDERLAKNAKQTYFLGLVFSSDGKRLYASMASITDPLGENKGSTGNGIAVYGFDSGKVSSQGFLKILLQHIAAGKVAAPINKAINDGKLIPYPGGLALIPGASADQDQLLVAENLSDGALLINANSGEVVHRFDLATHKIVPGSYPYAVVVSRNGKRAYVSLWNASRVAELDLSAGTVVRMIPVRPPAKSTDAGSHPTGLLFSPDQALLYVALANTDEVAVVDTASGSVTNYFSTRLPGQRYAGAYPVALASSSDGKRLFVADAGANSVAVIEAAKLTARSKGATGGKAAAGALGFIPTDWYPQALAVHGDDLIVASGKGKGTGPNARFNGAKHNPRDFTFILALVHGSLARVRLDEIERNLPALTKDAVNNSNLNRELAGVRFQRGGNPIKHVIYIIKENRTYDQILGDIDGGNGDPSLVMYGEEITPNQHKIAREFGILDNFYASGEVSGDGHNWSTAAIGSDYLEKTIEISYRGREHTYDYEGEVANRFPLEDDMADVNEPATGYLWGNVAKHGLTYRHYGEFIATLWCNEKATDASPLLGTPSPEGAACPKTYIEKGNPLPQKLGNPPGSPSPWPWALPRIARNVPTKPELRGHYDPSFPDFKLEYPDQLRADEFLNEFSEFVKARKTGKGRMLPNYVLLRLPNDHTSGTRSGYATPAAAIADNDLAVGRVVDAVSHSEYWDDTAILILEDDAQNGPDHVDAHRMPAFVISKYSPASAEKPFVDSTFYTTVSMIRTLEALLGLPPMNFNDATAPTIAKLFSGNGRHLAFFADYRNLNNGLLYQANRKDAPGAVQSGQMDFSHADAVDSAKLNAILWHERMGTKPMPPPKMDGSNRR